jgi:hypothetical protein
MEDYKLRDLRASHTLGSKKVVGRCVKYCHSDMPSIDLLGGNSIPGSSVCRGFVSFLSLFRVLRVSVVKENRWSKDRKALRHRRIFLIPRRHFV